MRRPLAVAITGGIGAGKSEALAAFARRGIPTISSDEIVHELLHDDEDVRAELVDRFGQRILDGAGAIDRTRVADVVFADPAQLDWLEQVLHPRVLRRSLAWVEGLARSENPPAVCVNEVPLLYETGGEERFDAVVVVTAPPELRAARARVSLAGREERLLPDEEKLRRADFGYVNDGTLEELDAFVAGVIEQLEAVT